ncbi:MAG: protein kinase [Tepidisphaeraceae bacterium]
MTLTPGTRLGPYEITAQIGEGGMGQVYRATDTRLKRQVAVKILPPWLAADADRLARFQREAEVLASLNHPHIAGIYGIEESPDVRALVMELVEGENLSQRIARGAIPIDEVLPIARQIAEALESSHEQGIVHRDLKPANIMVGADGTVKVLDFGLAKATDPLSTAAAAATLANSPTITSVAALTGAGMILGTAAYMSPEQARGKRLDRRADIWAFGAVLFEMLTGRRAFEGDDASITLASVMMKEPDWSALPVVTPSGVRRLLTRCLKKDPRARMRDIGEARIQIEELLSGSSDEAGVARLPLVVSVWRRALPWASAGALSFVLAMVLALWAPWRTPPADTPMRLSAEIGADASLATDGGPAAILSPDGARLALLAQGSDGRTRIYVRALEQLHAAGLVGTEGATNPFFSPDGQWIGFFADSKLKKIAVDGGDAVALCDAGTGGGSWSADGTIVFSSSGGLSKVASSGGEPEALTTLDRQAGEVAHSWPQLLPGGQAVLFNSGTSLLNYEPDIAVYSFSTKQRKTVHRGGISPRYLSSGHLVYATAGTLFAVPFDLARLEVTGVAAPVLSGVFASPGLGGSQFSAQFSFSDTGHLVYVNAASGDGKLSIYWMDLEGRLTPLREAPAAYSTPRFSPDGKRLAMHVADGKRVDIWVYDWERDTLTRLTFDGQVNRYPSWTPDGRRVAYHSQENAGAGLFWIRADGGGDPQRLTESNHQQIPNSWRQDGKVLAFHEVTPGTGADVMTLSMEGSDTSGWTPGKPQPFLSSASAEWRPAFSPDGRWLAYTSNESGNQEVYVRLFPGRGGKQQISSGGGVIPKWSPNGKDLFYRTASNRINVATYTATANDFRAEKPRQWSRGQFTNTSAGDAGNFDLHPDGKRFAVLMPPGRAEGVKVDKVTFVFNFFDEVRRTAPPTKR